MRVPPQDPVVTIDARGDESHSHPAYATIGASRVSGSANLFGSDFTHHGYVTVTIRKADLRRSLSNDLVHGYPELIEVALSEAQWATFVSSMNIGTGVPCTLQWQTGVGDIAEIADPPDRKGQFKKEAAEHLASVHASLEQLRDQIAATSLSAKVKTALYNTVRMAEINLSANTGFVADQFVEHIEKVTEHAKIELNAYMTNLIARTGLTALQAGPPPLELGPAKEETE